MHNDFQQLISKALNISPKQVSNTIQLLEEGATIPFIARYRKEMTGSLDEMQISDIKELLAKLKELEKRRESILKSIEEQGKLTPELKAQIENANTLTELEDIYLPYKPKRKTRATAAKEKGLEPLAEIILKQYERDIFHRAAQFINEEVKDEEEALQGARDIIAEWISESIPAREKLRRIFSNEAVITSKLVKGKEEEGIKYKDYFSYEEKLKNCPSHRLLALRRGEEEGILKINIAPSEERALTTLDHLFIKGNNESSEQVAFAVKDSYKRLLAPSLETEFRNSAKEKADEEAIKVFAENLRQLLLAPPLGQKRVLAIDPGFRTGCKIACLDAQGNFIESATIYPHPPVNKEQEAEAIIKKLISKYKIEAIAIGNGTAGRETEAFIKKIKFDNPPQVFMVSENGASIYSASQVAREEFPDMDITVRGAISIGRRLIDPLAELVKIDPKSIGVGQYQHDVDQHKLKQSLDQVVESAVNMVGVNVNTASKHLLMYVSGLGPQLAQNIVNYRAENGDFKSRAAIKKVPRMGEKAFEQCAGFLRITNAKNPLDNSAVHPESYAIVEKMVKDLNCSVSDLIKDPILRQKINLKNYISEKTGLPTLQDILQELAKPGRDPREELQVFEFDKNISKPEDLKPGMRLPGIITNITNFGAFVDVGVKQDGLVHISHLADKFISNPNDVVKLHQKVSVKVLEVDLARKRISFSMKE